MYEDLYIVLERARALARELEEFSFQHGGTLKNHKEWMLLTRELRAALERLTERCNRLLTDNETLTWIAAKYSALLEPVNVTKSDTDAMRGLESGGVEA